MSMSATNLQDKLSWCSAGEDSEAKFLADVAPLYGFSFIRHPGKATDKYETDFQMKDGSLDVDLKSISTPFFKAGNYGYDPSHTVTLNHKDYIRYMYKYPDWGNRKMVILLWVQISKQEEYNIAVDEISGVWSLPLWRLDGWIRNRELRCHSYQQRTGECGSNAKHSWLIDLRQCTKRRTQDSE